MKIKAHVFGFAGSLTIGIIYSLFAISLKLWPKKVISLIGTTHMLPKLELISSFIKVTPQGIILGLTGHMIIGFIVFWLIAVLYNILQK